MNLVPAFTRSPNNVYTRTFISPSAPPNVFVVQHFPENVNMVLLVNEMPQGTIKMLIACSIVSVDSIETARLQAYSTLNKEDRADFLVYVQ